MNLHTVQLLRRFHGGDQKALEQLLAENLDWIRAQVKRRLGPHLRDLGETQDFVQDAMVQALEYGPRFELEDQDQFRRLVARIVENDLRSGNRYLHQECRDVRRRRALDRDTVLHLDPPQKEVTRPSQHAEREEQVAWVHLALELLPHRDREVIWLREFEKLGFGEIAARLGQGEDSVRMRFHRALPKLAKQVMELREGHLARALDEDA